MIAIVIPAYKFTYFEQTLQSIAEQTDKDFTVYIGDDNSPYNLEEIVDKYKTDINIIYHKFEENIGGKDLIKQWNRCVRLVKDEEYIWLFSDDDYMPKDCVGKVKKYLTNNKDLADVFHINAIVVNEKGNDITNKERVINFPEKISCEDYLNYMFLGKDNTWGINFIVKQSVIKEKGLFENFDLAWNADRASWLKFSYPKGILTIPNTSLCWRYGGNNISSLKQDKEIVLRKAKSRLIFFKWIKNFIKSNNLKVLSPKHVILLYIIRIVYCERALSFKEKVIYFIKYIKILFS